MESSQTTRNFRHLIDHVLTGAAQVAEKYHDFNRCWLKSAISGERWLKLAN